MASNKKPLVNPLAIQLSERMSSVVYLSDKYYFEMAIKEIEFLQRQLEEQKKND